LVASVTTGCDHNFEASHDDDPTGTVVLALSAVPEDVRCVRVDAAGPYRKKTATLEIKVGAALESTLAGFPLGRVVFTGEAFTRACEEVTASTNPDWVSEDVVASVVLGTLTRVTLNMQRNGRVGIGVNFPGEPSCSAPGAACKSARECCAGTCRGEVCGGGGDAGAGGDAAVF
jgi:hypothetical protein